MNDAQHPMDGDGGSGHQPRRTSLRLRDAETVATTRRDIFGDGSLLDALAGPPPVRDDTRQDPEPLPQEPALQEPFQGPTPHETVQQLPHAEAGAVEPAEASGDTPEPAEAADEMTRGQEDPGSERRFANPASFPF